MLIFPGLAIALLQVMTAGPIIGHAANDDPFDQASPLKARSQLRLCRPLLEHSVGGTLSAIAVSKVRHSGSRTSIAGVARAFLRARPAPPGQMSPMHVINARFSYVCHFRGQTPIRADTHRLRG